MVYSGPTTADPAAQSEVVRSLMQQRVDALMVAPNDPDSMAPVITEAQGQGTQSRYGRHRCLELQP